MGQFCNVLFIPTIKIDVRAIRDIKAKVRNAVYNCYHLVE